MTWLEILPTVGVCGALLCGVGAVSTLHERAGYRGYTDARIKPALGGRFHGQPDFIAHRLAQRDQRLSLYPQKAEWVHPVWRPKTYPESK